MTPLVKQTNPDKPIGGRYKIISELGAGGFGQTFLAEDLHLPDHPRCVVKQLKPQASDAETLQTARRLFDIEARVLYKLGNHDQIPRLLAHFEENQEFYLAQELVDGEPLTQEIKEGQRWSETQVIAFFQDLLEVLAFVHEQNVIHRDLKPSNLMRRRQDGRIVLIDFGAVKQVSTQMAYPQTGHTKTISIGTQGYTPKEQLGGNPRFSSDVYSAGIVGIQALTGVHPRHLPEDANTGEIMWRDRTPQVSYELAEFLDCMVRYDFRARFPTAAEALSALRNLSASNTQYGLMSQPFYEDSGTVPMQQWQSPASASESRSSSGQVPTNHWTPTTPSAGSQPPVSNTGATVNAAQFQPPEHSSTNTLPTVVASGGSRKKPVIVLSSLAVLAALGGTFLLSKTFLPPQFANQTTDPSKVPAASPNPSTNEQSTSPTVASSPSVSPSSTPEETPESPTVASSPSVSASATPTVASVSPVPTSSPVATQASPTPAASPSPPPTKAAPASVPSAPKPAPSPAAPQAAELVKQADRAREAGQYQKAIELYDQAIAVNPNLAEAHWGRCYSLNSVQQPDDGLQACNKALAINPNYAEALWSRGAALEQKQNPLEALKSYKKATDNKPNFAEAWNNQGVALLKLNRPSEAVAALDRATKLKPDFANAWANRGAALWKTGRYDDAIASLERAIQLNPNDQDIINLRQQVREQLGR